MTTGSLFTQYFLQDGIRQTEAYQSLPAEAVAQIKARLAKHWALFSSMASPSEADTESQFIFPVMEELGWEWLPQAVVDGRRRDVADALLFADPAAKNLAMSLQPTARFVHGTVVVENEAKRTNLDRASARGEAPSSQILRYMSRAETQSNGALVWGLLTNGGTWRLYFNRATSRSEGFVGINLADLIDPPPLAPIPIPDGAPPDHWMRVFLLLFRPEAFRPEGPDGATFLDQAMQDGRTYQARVTEELSAVIFDQVFPRLVRAFAQRDPNADVADAAWRSEAREGAMRLLYRLLFLLYAEDRDLLPMQHPGYRDNSLRRMREEAARKRDSGLPFSASGTREWAGLLALSHAVANGDPALGLPPYNGNLFRDHPDDILARVTLSDAVLMDVIETMSRETQPSAGRSWINYRDLSVQHLGSIYERLLEHDVVDAGPVGIALRPSPYARKATGSFYTREELVLLIFRRAVRPLIAERRSKFTVLLEQQAAAQDVASTDAPDAERHLDPARLQALEACDPADAILGLRICDPAMGSGHFLVSLIDQMTDAILDAMADAAALVPGGCYRSPVAARIVAIRERILANAREHGWSVRDNALDDKHIVRRMVLKRCVFGVDLNPMAVELAKLSLWLHSFTVGAPLSFLDHHLRIGNSLFGEFVGSVVAKLQEEYGLAISQAVVSAQAAAVGMASIEASADADIAEVDASRVAFERVEAATAPLRAFLGLYHASRWLAPVGDADRIARKVFFGGGYGDPVHIANGAAMRAPADAGSWARKPSVAKPVPITAAEAYIAATAFVAQAHALIAESRFLHWEAAFPGVWERWETASPAGGFDAVIGNPPWDRIKMQEVEWWAARRGEIAQISRASDRKTAIASLRRAGDAMAADYDRAAARAVRSAEVAAFLPVQKADGTSAGAYPLYPLFARGDVNLYALFVERAGQIVRPDGIVGLLGSVSL